jgi:hypothetical protein
MKQEPDTTKGYPYVGKFWTTVTDKAFENQKKSSLARLGRFWLYPLLEMQEE